MKVKLRNNAKEVFVTLKNGYRENLYTGIYLLNALGVPSGRNLVKINDDSIEPIISWAMHQVREGDTFEQK